MKLYYLICIIAFIELVYTLIGTRTLQISAILIIALSLIGASSGDKRNNS